MVGTTDFALNADGKYEVFGEKKPAEIADPLAEAVAEPAAEPTAAAEGEAVKVPANTDALQMIRFAYEDSIKDTMVAPVLWNE
jgi:hypothetical protein